MAMGNAATSSNRRCGWRACRPAACCRSRFHARVAAPGRRRSRRACRTRPASPKWWATSGTPSDTTLVALGEVRVRSQVSEPGSGPGAAGRTRRHEKCRRRRLLQQKALHRNRLHGQHGWGFLLQRHLREVADRTFAGVGCTCAATTTLASRRRSKRLSATSLLSKAVIPDC